MVTPDIVEPLQQHFILWLQKFCKPKARNKNTSGYSGNSDKEHTVMEQSNIIYTVRCFAIRDAFVWQGAFSKPDFHFCWILIESIEVNQLMVYHVIKDEKKKNPRSTTYAII